MGVAGRRTGDPELARDAAQQVFVLLARKAALLLRHDRLAGWLYRTASFEAAKLQLSEHRRRSRQSQYAALPADDLACHEHWQLLEEAMSELTDRERHILTERRLKDEPTTLEELASEYGVSRERVRQIEVRAFEKLQKQMRAAATDRNLMSA